MRPTSALPPDSLDTSLVDGPPEESFDEKYNKRLEFPTSLVGTILLHVVVGAIFVFIIHALANSTDASDVKVTLVNVWGLDDTGAGSPGSGGTDDPSDFDKTDPSFGPDLAVPMTLPEVEIARQDLSGVNPDISKLPIAPSNIPAYRQLDEKIRKILLAGIQGAGPGKGKNNDGTAGAGPGGTGTDSTLARNMRWVLRFKVSSGRDYIDQLKLMGAEVLVPYPDSDKCVLIPDLAKEREHKPATEDDLNRLAKKIKFSDSRPVAVNSVLKTLELADVPAKSFWAFFPGKIEEELSRKELSYQNRKSEDIEETIFAVEVKDGKYNLRVVEQKIKK